VHRDLKPGNIVLSCRSDGAVHPKVIDFGISKSTRGALSHETAPGALLGSSLYMAPEQAQDASQADAASDQYSLGVTLHVAATGRRPFEAPARFELMRAIMSAPVAPPSTWVAGLPRELR